MKVPHCNRMNSQPEKPRGKILPLRLERIFHELADLEPMGLAILISEIENKIGTAALKRIMRKARAKTSLKKAA